MPQPGHLHKKDFSVRSVGFLIELVEEVCGSGKLCKFCMFPDVFDDLEIVASRLLAESDQPLCRWLQPAQARLANLARDSTTDLIQMNEHVVCRAYTSGL